MLRLAICSIIRCVVFTILAFLVLTLIADGDLLRRVLAVFRVQPKLVGRHLGTLLVQLREEDIGIGVLGDRCSVLRERRPHRHQLFAGFLPERGQLD